VFVKTIDMGVANMFKHSQTLGMFGDGVRKIILLHQGGVIGVQWHQFHHQVGGAPESIAVESFAHQDSCNAFIFLSNFHMDSLDELVFGLGKRGGRVGCTAGREGQGLGVLGTIPNILPLKAKGNGRLVRVQAVQEPFQELGKVGEIDMPVQLEQPANCGDKGSLNGAGINLMGQVFHFLVEAWVEVLWGVGSNQNTDVHCLIHSAGAETLEVLAHHGVRLTQLLWLKKDISF